MARLEGIDKPINMEVLQAEIERERGERSPVAYNADECWIEAPQMQTATLTRFVDEHDPTAAEAALPDWQRELLDLLAAEEEPTPPGQRRDYLVGRFILTELRARVAAVGGDTQNESRPDDPTP